MTVSLVGSMLVHWAAHVWSDAVDERIRVGEAFRRERSVDPHSERSTEEPRPVGSGRVPDAPPPRSYESVDEVGSLGASAP